MRSYSPREIVDFAGEKKDNIGIAYTYNEPIVWFEYMMDIAEVARRKGMKNVMVTNGFINPQPLDEVLKVMDAFNVDLKAFTEDFYLTQTMSKLKPVKESLKQIRRSGKHLEITYLIIPGKNDDPNDFVHMLKWIKGELGDDTVLHLSRYFPTYKMSAPPTPSGLVSDLFEMAKLHLKYVYIGNLNTNTGQNTYCPSCDHKVIDRSRYDTWVKGLDESGACAKCGQKIIKNL
jgi:pyruvate formate lyase activating enzyme